MSEKSKGKPGRKEDFPGIEVERITFILPKTTRQLLDMHMATNDNQTRNQYVNEALLKILTEDTNKK
ncbi:MAG: hypothetical protein AAF696_26200 [Bacteroidota bacterium]